MELSETAIEEKIRMCVGMPLQHISRRTTQNRSQNVPMAGAGFAAFRGKTRVHGAAAHGNCQRQPSKKNSRAHGSAASAHLAPNNRKPRANAPMAGADGIARFPLARANVSGARHAEAPTGGKPSKRGSVLQRAEAPPPHRPMQGRPAALLLPRAAFLPQFGPRRRRPRSGGNPRLTRAWRIRIMSIAFRGCNAFARIPFAPVPQLDRGSAS